MTTNILLGLNPPSQNLLAEMLESLGYHVLTDNDGPEVSRDLLITDTSVNGIASAMVCVRTFPNLAKVLVFVNENKHYKMDLPHIALTVYFFPLPTNVASLQSLLQTVLHPTGQLPLEFEKLEVASDFAGQLYIKDSRLRFHQE